MSNVRIGDRIEVLWPRDQAFYPATVAKKQQDGLQQINYDDGDTELLNMRTEKWRFLTAPPRKRKRKVSACLQQPPSSEKGSPNSVIPHLQHSEGRNEGNSTGDMLNDASLKRPEPMMKSGLSLLEYVPEESGKREAGSFRFRRSKRKRVVPLKAESNNCPLIDPAPCPVTFHKGMRKRQQGKVHAKIRLRPHNIHLSAPVRNSPPPMERRALKKVSAQSCLHQSRDDGVFIETIGDVLLFEMEQRARSFCDGNEQSLKALWEDFHGSNDVLPAFQTQFRHVYDIARSAMGTRKEGKELLWSEVVSAIGEPVKLLTDVFHSRLRNAIQFQIEVAIKKSLNISANVQKT